MTRVLLRPLPSSEYDRYMASPEWAATKAWWRSHRGSWRRRCRVCRRRHYDLHHRTYTRLGCEHLRDMVPLCHHHHVGVHRWERFLVRRGVPRPRALRWATRLYVVAHRRAWWALSLVILLIVMG